MWVNSTKTAYAVHEFEDNALTVTQGLDIKSGAAAAQASRVSGAVEQGSKYVAVISSRQHVKFSLLV